MFERVLVPLDGTPHAERALPIAVAVARASGGSLVLQQVVGPSHEYGGRLTQTPRVQDQLLEAALAEASSSLALLPAARLVAALAAPGLGALHLIQGGQAASRSHGRSPSIPMWRARSSVQRKVESRGRGSRGSGAAISLPCRASGAGACSAG